LLALNCDFLIFATRDKMQYCVANKRWDTLVFGVSWNVTFRYSFLVDWLAVSIHHV